jgi:hypothetical protein
MTRRAHRAGGTEDALDLSYRALLNLTSRCVKPSTNNDEVHSND